MSFRDLQQQHQQARRRAPPPSSSPQRRIVVEEPVPVVPTPAAASRKGKITIPPLSSAAKKMKSVVLHGKVQHVYSSSSSSSHSSNKSVVDEATVRQTVERRTEFGNLTHELQQFAKLVRELEAVLLQEATTSPAASWRARILIKAAQESQACLALKLQTYEAGLHKNGTDVTSLAQSSACVKLQRDFRRSSKTLAMLLSNYERQQRAEMAMLGANKGSLQVTTNVDEDYFDRALRQQELQQINDKMHRVQGIYQELATLVDAQQPQLDALHNATHEARGHVERGAAHVGCLAWREESCGGHHHDDDNSVQAQQHYNGCQALVPEHFTLRELQPQSSPTSVMAVNSNSHNLVPTWDLTSMRDDFLSVQRDILDIGRLMRLQSAKLPCSGSGDGDGQQRVHHRIVMDDDEEWIEAVTTTTSMPFDQQTSASPRATTLAEF